MSRQHVKYQRRQQYMLRNFGIKMPIFWNKLQFWQTEANDTVERA